MKAVELKLLSTHFLEIELKLKVKLKLKNLSIAGSVGWKCCLFQAWVNTVMTS